MARMPSPRNSSPAPILSLRTSFAKDRSAIGVVLSYPSPFAGKVASNLQFSPSPVAQQWERVAEGRVRALCRHEAVLFGASHISRKSPHPPFGHLLPSFGREKGE